MFLFSFYGGSVSHFLCVDAAVFVFEFIRGCEKRVTRDVIISSRREREASTDNSATLTLWPFV